LCDAAAVKVTDALDATTCDAPASAIGGLFVTGVEVFWLLVSVMVPPELFWIAAVPGEPNGKRMLFSTVFASRCSRWLSR
jgi:hypothetical protein